jgi:hypothetical protein
LVLVELREESRLNTDQRLAGFGGNNFVGFQTAVAANVKHGVATLHKDSADQQAAMAVRRVLFAAQKSHAKALHTGFKPRDGRFEPGVLAEASINDMARRIVIGRIRRTSA